MFDFDCPSRYFDLSSVDSSRARLSIGREDGEAGSICSVGDDELQWFETVHPSHEAMESQQSTFALSAHSDISQSMPKGRSGGIRSGAVLRVNIKSSGYDHSEPPARKVPTKTAVALVSFENSQPDNRKGSDSAPLNLKLLKKDEPNKKPPAPSQTVNMKSKLEEYKTKKASQSSAGTTTKTAVASTKPVGPVAKKAVPISSGKTSAADNDDMLTLLKKHNEKFAAVPIYEPPMHSVRDVRNWERSTGRAWASLTAEERSHANKEITEMKKAMSSAV